MQVRECKYVCRIVLQLILKGEGRETKQRNETKGKSRKVRQVNRLLRKERRKTNTRRKGDLFIYKFSSLRNNAVMTQFLRV